MGQALYRKYRSKSLDEIVGQEHITKTLAEALKQGRISHAYLFTGPKGVGKTSIARILAHEINGLPYTDDSTHIDIIEIDAASNRRIDEIRELREKVYVAPTSAKYKVYIIDEVHMLTREAFNALLKTLEEPPAHVVFILATTEAHKLPETIVSRTQRFTFKPVDKAKVIEHLKSIAKSEKITVDEAALELLAEHGEGSFRDSISLLDQARSHGDALTLDSVQTLLGIPPEQNIDLLLDALKDGGLSNTAVAVAELYQQGYQAAAVAKQLSQRLRQQLVNGNLSLSSEQTLQLLSQLIEVPAAHDPERFLEVVLLSATPATDQPVAPEKVDPPIEIPKPARPIKPIDKAVWQEVLSTLKQKHNTLYGVVRMAHPSFQEDGVVQLAFGFEFHRKRLSDVKNQQKLVDVIQEASGQAVQIVCIVDKALGTEPAVTAPVEPVLETPNNLATISNIFGGAELVE